MIKNYLERFDFKQNKKIILGSIASVVLIIVVYSFFSSPIKNTANKDMVLSIPAMGNLDDLDSAMKKNGELHQKVKELLSYDEAYLFVNYTQVDSLVTHIMFLWIGMTSKEIEENDRQVLVETFIRRAYNLPEDEPIKNSPFLKKRPWSDLFQQIKARLLMQGQGHKVYNGVAYYNSENDKMVVEGELSQSYVEGFAEFVKSQPKNKQKGYINNYLVYINETLGLKNLSKKEKKILKDIGFL